MADSSKAPIAGKPTVPDKPYADFPLFPHQTGRWAKKIKGRLRFYGRWGRTVGGVVTPVEDVEKSAAEAKLEFDRCWPQHSQGLEAADKATVTDVVEGVPVTVDYLTMKSLVNQFLTAKREQLRNKELSLHTFSEYHRTCGKLVKHFGKFCRVDALKPDDFKKLRTTFAKGCNLVTLGSKINRARVVFNYAITQRLIDKAVDYGDSFDKPTPLNLRLEKNSLPPNMFSRDECLMIIAALEGKPLTIEGLDAPLLWPACPVMLSMVLLGLNCGFGNTDCSSLPKSAVNLKTGWVEFARVKTGIKRRIPLWPETTAAIKKALPLRPDPIDPEDAKLCFLTERGTRFVRVQQSANHPERHVTINSLGRRFEKLLTVLGIGTQRPGIGFYTFRHVFETIGGGCRDQVAVDAIMGHVDGSTGAGYREGFEDERLQAVVDHVHRWLWQ